MRHLRRATLLWSELSQTKTRSLARAGLAFESRGYARPRSRAASAPGAFGSPQGPRGAKRGAEASGDDLLRKRVKDAAGCLEPVFDLIARVRLDPGLDDHEPARRAGRSGSVGPDAKRTQVVALAGEVVA